MQLSIAGFSYRRMTYTLSKNSITSAEVMSGGTASKKAPPVGGAVPG